MNTIKQGDTVLVEGRLQTVSYTDGPYVYIAGEPFHYSQCVLPKFKAGDRVNNGYRTCTIAGVKCESGRLAYDYTSGDWDYQFGLELVILPSGNAIVIRYENDKYQPNSPPKVHQSREEATKEAERLAVKEPGVSFTVWTLASTSTAAKPTVTTVSA